MRLYTLMSQLATLACSRGFNTTVFVLVAAALLALAHAMAH
jgi:hypothetical protein